MFSNSKVVNGFAVDDLDRARAFYGEKLGLEIEMLDSEHGLMMLKLHPERDTLMYLSGDMTPASYTILNFEVDDIDAAVDQLAERDIPIERYEDFQQDEKGVMRGPGPQIAWFEDPAGNVLSVLQQG